MALKFAMILMTDQKNIHELCQRQFAIWQRGHPVASIVRIVFGNIGAENTDGATE